MEQLKERFVKPNVAEQLKEKGLKFPFFFYYRTDEPNRPIHHANTLGALVYENKMVDDEVVAAPTQAIAMDWLEDKYGFFIEINRSIDTNGTYHYGYLILDKLCNFVFKQHTDFLSSYDAANAALEYCLENLIR